MSEQILSVPTSFLSSKSHTMITDFSRKALFLLYLPVAMMAGNIAFAQEQKEDTQKYNGVEFAREYAGKLIRIFKPDNNTGSSSETQQTARQEKPQEAEPAASVLPRPGEEEYRRAEKIMTGNDMLEGNPQTNQSIRLFRESVKKGFEPAKYKLLTIYDKAESDIRSDYTNHDATNQQALKHIVRLKKSLCSGLKETVQQNNPFSRYYFFTYCENPDSAMGKKELASARNQFMTLAKQGNADAMYMLGIIARESENNSDNNNWLIQAARQGSRDAICALDTFQSNTNKKTDPLILKKIRELASDGDECAINRALDIIYSQSKDKLISLAALNLNARYDYTEIIIDSYLYSSTEGDIGVYISQKEEQLNKQQKSRYTSLLRAAEKDLAGFIEHNLK